MKVMHVMKAITIMQISGKISVHTDCNSHNKHAILTIHTSHGSYSSHGCHSHHTIHDCYACYKPITVMQCLQVCYPRKLFNCMHLDIKFQFLKCILTLLQSIPLFL